MLFDPGGKELTDTVYSASCGGHTEHNENVWSDMAPLETLRGHRDGPAGDAYPGGVTEAVVARFIAEPPPSWCGLPGSRGAPIGSGGR